MSDIRSTVRPEPDKLLQDIADYVLKTPLNGTEAFETARYCLMDTLGCAFLALDYPACTKLLGPVVPGADMQSGARVPGTSYCLDPVRAAFNFGAMVRWLDFNDTWLAAEWGHPSDNLGGILMVADYINRQDSKNKKPLLMRDVLTAMIKAYEIQGVLALENSFNRVGLDHVLLVRVASTAVLTQMLGGNREQIINAVSNAFIDGGALRTYRHAPNTGSRKSWAAGDATSRATWHALNALRGEMGYPTAMSAKTWGFQDVLFKSKSVVLSQSLGAYVMENILFKLSFPAEFHAQTAVEAAVKLHPETSKRLDEIDTIIIETQESAVRIIDKTGPLNNPADRDHCIQYMVAIGLLKGSLTAQDYEDEAAKDPRVNQLRDKMIVKEYPQFTKEYLQADKRAIGNAIQIKFKDGKKTERIEINYPIGHRRRRAEGTPVLLEKFERNLTGRLDQKKQQALMQLCANQSNLEATPVSQFVDLCIK